MAQLEAIPAVESDKNKSIVTLLQKEGKKLSNFIRKRVRNLEDAEDILQDVYGLFVQNFDLNEPFERASSWLYSVARNRIIDASRKRKETSISELTANEVISYSSDGRHNPETKIWNDEFMSALFDALEELPENQRQVYVEHELKGVPFKELSKKYGLSVNTLISRKRYAILHLRNRLNDLYNELND